MHAVRRLRGEGGVVIDHVRQCAAKHGKAAGVDKARRVALFAQGFEQQHQAVQIDLHAQIKIGLRRRTDHGGQMPDHIHTIGHAGNDVRVGDVAGHQLDTRVVGHVFAREGVKQYDALNWAGRLTFQGQRVQIQQALGQLLADEAGTASDQNAHGCSCFLSLWGAWVVNQSACTVRWRCSPRPSMPKRMTCPARKNTGSGLMPRPTPGGVPVEMTSPGCSDMQRLR